MAVYEPLDIEVDRDAIRDTIINDIQAGLPGLKIPPGGLLWMWINSVATRHAAELERLQERAQGEFEAQGEKMFRLPKVTDVAATITVTIVANDTAGHTIEAGNTVSVIGPGDERVAFAFPLDTVIAPGDDTVMTTLVALAAGTGGNALSEDPQLDNTRPWVQSVSVVAPSAGGVDGETSDEYVDRLGDVLETLGFTLTTADRFAVAARNLPGVGSALAIDLYKPGPPYDGTAADTTAPGHLTVAVRAPDGTALTSGARDVVEAFLEDRAISILEVWVIDPTYTAITVEFEAVAKSGFDPAVVNAAAEQSIRDFLDPGTWGFDGGDRQEWIDKPVVRFKEVSRALLNTEGVGDWTLLEVNGGTADVALTGPAGVPAAGATVSGTTEAA